jgi:hypothetical protein
MFLVNRYLANGEFDKVKARLVVDRRDQNLEMYPNKSSPTVGILSLFRVLGLFCQKLWQVVMTIDIKAAFVQTTMMGQPIFMQLDPKVMQCARDLNPELNKYVWIDGWMDVFKQFF